MLEFHQFDRASELLRDTVLQFRASEREVHPLRRTDMGRQRLFRILIKTQRLVQKKFRKPTCSKPRKAAIVVEATKRKAPISLKTVPTQKGRVRCDTSHGFDRIPHEFMNISEVNNHGYRRLAQTAAKTTDDGRAQRHSENRSVRDRGAYPTPQAFKRRFSVSSRVQIAFPFLQGWVPAAGSQRPRSGTLDLQHFLGLTVDSDLHAHASVSVAPVCLHPLRIFKRRPVPIAFNLISALHSDGPLPLPVVQPHIGGGRIAKPAATRFELPDRSPPGWSGLSICDDDGR